MPAGFFPSRGALLETPVDDLDLIAGRGSHEGVVRDQEYGGTVDFSRSPQSGQHVLRRPLIEIPRRLIGENEFR